TEVARPQAALSHLLMERPDDTHRDRVGLVVLAAREHEVERLDGIADERIDPVELGLELRLGLEVPRHVFLLDSLVRTFPQPLIGVISEPSGPPRNSTRSPGASHGWSALPWRARSSSRQPVPTVPDPMTSPGRSLVLAEAWPRT